MGFRHSVGSTMSLYNIIKSSMVCSWGWGSTNFFLPTFIAANSSCPAVLPKGEFLLLPFLVGTSHSWYSIALVMLWPSVMTWWVKGKLNFYGYSFYSLDVRCLDVRRSRFLRVDIPYLKSRYKWEYTSPYMDYSISLSYSSGPKKNPDALKLG